MSDLQLQRKIREQQEQIRRLRSQGQERGGVNYEEKYKRALRSIQEIIRANKQIKEELDNLRNMRQTDLEAFSNAQKDEFRKAFDALLKDKNAYVLNLQALTLQNEKLKFTIAELQGNSQATRDNSNELISKDDKQTSPKQVIGSPQKSGSRDANQALRQKQAEFHRTISNYEEHHSNLTRSNKRLQQRIVQLEGKLQNSDKNWRVKLQTKELEVIDIKALTRQEFTEQISALRKENSLLKLANNDLTIKIQSIERTTAGLGKKGGDNYDWEAELLREMIAVKANLEPLRQQIGELQEMNFYEKEQSVRERTNLQTHVLELQAEVERQNDSIKNLERKIVEFNHERAGLEEKAERLKAAEEENKLLNGRVIVMESREIALKNRTGEELQERILEFESRVELLLSNKEGLKELREVGIHQLLALKAYILQLDGKLKELLSSNTHLLRKYKSYKQRYQGALKEQKTYGMAINTLKMKILGYDKLVLKLQNEMESLIKINTQEMSVASRRPEEDGKTEVYRKKYELAKEKLEIQEKYKEQEIQTIKLNYEARLMEITIKLEDMKSLRETIDLYRVKNEELQSLVVQKESELYESKIIHSKAPVEQMDRSVSSTRQTKDIINNLHITIKNNDQTIFKLQSELRTKDDNYKRTITKLQREISELKDDNERAVARREVDYNLTLDQERKQYKFRISELQEKLRLEQISQKEEQTMHTGELQVKLHKLQLRVQEAEAKRDEEVFNRRRLQKQIMDLNHDTEEYQRVNADMQLRLSQVRLLQRQNEELRAKMQQSAKQSMRGSYIDYQLQGKDTIIRKLNNQILELRQASGTATEKDITITSLRNEVSYLKGDINALHDSISKYSNEIVFLKGNLDASKTSYSTGMDDIIKAKEQVITQLRRDVAGRDQSAQQLEEEKSRFEETIRKLRRDLTEIDLLRQEAQRLQTALNEKTNIVDRLRQENVSYDQEIDRYKRELVFVKQNFQKQSYDLLEKEDEVSKLKLEVNTIAVRNKEQLENRYNDQIEQKDRYISRLNADLQTLKNNLTTVSEDRDYHEESTRRANNDLSSLRAQINELEQENSQLRDQLYGKTQELGKLQFTSETYRSQVEEYASKEEEVYKMRSELFAVRNEVGIMQDEMYAKDAAIARITKELSYLKDREGQLQEELRTQTQANGKLIYQINALRSGDEESQSVLQERDVVILKLTAETASIKNKYRELQEEMEEREQSFGFLTQQMSRLKGNLSYCEDDLQAKETQIDRLNRERQVLREQIEELGHEITQRNQEVARAKQETFAVRMEGSDREYQDKMRHDQELFSLKSKITLLEQSIEDKDGEVRRALIELETSRNRQPTVMTMDEGELQDLRLELGKKQRELINYKFELQDRQYQLDAANSSLVLMKATVSQCQQQQEEDRDRYDNLVRERNVRERKLQDEISLLKQESERKPNYAEPLTASYSITYTEQEMATVNEQLSIRQRELNSVRYELEDKLYLIENLSSKVKMQERLIKQLEEQREQDNSRRSSQVQDFSRRERQYKQPEVHQQYQQYQQPKYQKQLPEEEVLSQSVQPESEGKAHAAKINENLVTVKQSYERGIGQEGINSYEHISEVHEQLETSQGFISRRQDPPAEPAAPNASSGQQPSVDREGESSRDGKDSLIMQLQREKLSESQVGRITIKIQNSQMNAHAPQFSQNVFVPPQAYVAQPPFSPFQNQPQYIRLPQSQSQVGRQVRHQQQQFVRYSQQVPFKGSLSPQAQQMMRPPMIVPAQNVGNFRSF